jgi:RNA recognition motif-containing protein
MVPQMPIYSSNTSGMSVNVGNGAVLTEPRGIFISGLDYKARSRDLEALLKRVGRPVEFKLQKDKNGRSKGSATAKFATAHEAQYAISRLNGQRFEGASHKDKPLSVRFDTDKTVVGQVQPPVIVNGSTNY